MQCQAEECTNFPPGGWLGTRLHSLRVARRSRWRLFFFLSYLILDGGQRATLEPKKPDWLLGSEECAEL